MNVITSLWTGCDQFRISYSTLLAATLSHCLARRQYGPIHFVTDNFGMFLAKTLGWEFAYQSNHLRVLPKEISHIWAAGKLMACTIPTGRFMQYDWDVLFRKKVEMPKEEFFSQSNDDPTHYRKLDTEAIMCSLHMQPGGPAYNMGVMGGERDVLKIYAEEALKLCLGRLRHFKKSGTACSIIAEQYFAGIFCEMTGIQMGTLFKELPTDQEAEQLGYVHLQGTSKGRDEIMLKVRWRMEREFPEELHNFERGFVKLKEQRALAA